MNYADLSIRPKGDLEGTLLAAKRLGYLAVALEGTEEGVNLPNNDVSRGLLVARRRTFIVDEASDLESLMSRVPSGVIVSVAPMDYKAYRRAALHKRVDIIRLLPESHVRPDKETKHLFSQRGGGAVEVSLRPLINGDVGELRYVYDVVSRSYRIGLRLAIVSDAENKFELWHPLQVVSLLVSLGFPTDFAISSLTSSPGFILSRRGAAHLKGASPQGS